MIYWIIRQDQQDIQDCFFTTLRMKAVKFYPLRGKPISIYA